MADDTITDPADQPIAPKPRKVVKLAAGKKVTAGPRPNTRPPNSPGGMPGDPVPGSDKGIPKAYIDKLKEAGYAINKQGKIVRTGSAGSAAGAVDPEKNPEVFRLLQKGWNQFGLTNEHFDPLEAYYAKDVGGLVNLGTGGYLNGSGVLTDAQLEHLRNVGSYNEQALFEKYQKNNTYNGYTPAAFQTLEAFQKYLAGARANYQEQFNPTPQAAPRGPSYQGGFDVEGAGYDDLNQFGMGDVVSMMMAARARKQVAEGFYSEPFPQENVGGEE